MITQLVFLALPKTEYFTALEQLIYYFGIFFFKSVYVQYTENNSSMNRPDQKQNLSFITENSI